MGGLRETTMMVRLQQYSEEIRACKSSGLTVAKWCEENGIGIKTYYYRQRKVRKALLEMGEPRLPALTCASQTEFAKVPMAMVTRPGDKPATSISVNGIKVDVYENAGIETIKSSIKAVMEIC